MTIKFGPSGMGSIIEVEKVFKNYSEKGIKSCEIPFTYQVYIKKKEDALKVKSAAEKFEIELSIHAPYWINLNSSDEEKVAKSVGRILDSCEKAHWMSAKNVVFHCGYYGKDSREETFENIKERIVELQRKIKENDWNVTLCPEVVGKKNVFGSIEEISKLVNETGCGFCIDFAHILARYGEYNFDLVREKFPQNKWHCHFSGIEYGEKGEKRHKKTDEGEWNKVLSKIPKDKGVVIINESPQPIEDSLLGIEVNRNKK